MIKELVFGCIALLVVSGLAGAITGGPGVTVVKDFQFYDHASDQYFSVTASPNVMASQKNSASGTDFQVYDRISKTWFDVTDDDLIDANAWIDVTGGVPLISSPFSGKAYGIRITETAMGEDYLECIPLVGMVAIEPSGYVELPSGTGNKFWSTAYGPTGDGMDEHTYMYVEGWNPFVLWQHMGGN